jgi:hypothetical protein
MHGQNICGIVMDIGNAFVSVQGQLIANGDLTVNGNINGKIAPVWTPVYYSGIATYTIDVTAGSDFYLNLGDLAMDSSYFDQNPPPAYGLFQLTGLTTLNNTAKTIRVLIINDYSFMGNIGGINWQVDSGSPLIAWTTGPPTISNSHGQPASYLVEFTMWGAGVVDQISGKYYSPT